MFPILPLLLAAVAWSDPVEPAGLELSTPPIRPTGPAEPSEPDPIVNGEEESGWPQTVALGAATFSACTGSVIAPRVVLTAGHCGADFPVELLVGFGQAIFGPDVGNATHRIGFVDFALHPDYVPLATDGLGNQTLPEYDVALLELAEDAPVDPIWINLDRLKDRDIGEQVVSVGFGITSAAGAGGGVKRSAKLNVDGFDEMFLLSYNASNPNNANICSGDSGGPQYHKNAETGEWEQWAIHSWGDSNCVYNSGSTRTDVAAEFILGFVEKVHGTSDFCALTGRYGDDVCDTGCDQVDPDCLAPAPGSLAAGAPAGFDGGGCDTSGGAPLGWALALPLLALGLRRRHV